MTQPPPPPFGFHRPPSVPSAVMIALVVEASFVRYITARITSLTGSSCRMPPLVAADVATPPNAPAAASLLVTLDAAAAPQGLTKKSPAKPTAAPPKLHPSPIELHGRSSR